ncbi:MAG TPA: exo-beta-1,3-glucanase [Magnetospirillaceae bacterium]
MTAMIAVVCWWWFDRPVPVTESWDGPLQSVSFAPYRGHQDPIDQDVPPPEQVEADLKSLVGHVQAVRTYGTTRGLEVVPKFAQALGLKVTMGAWLTSDHTPVGAAANDAEIAGLIDAANRYPDTVTRVIVGNEVLLRNDLPPEKLIAYIQRVKAAVKQPVSYADVWVFFLKHPDVAQALDVITIHVLPFWEDEPVSIEGAEEHMIHAVEAIRAAFPGKPILIGETGWPSMGRDRGAAVVNTINEARYVRAVPDIAKRHDLDYNIVEAFDQPWKASLENTVGANWGILDAGRTPKFAMSGPVTEVADWPRRAGVAIVAGLAVMLWFGRGLRGLNDTVVLALLCQGLAWLAVTTGFHISAVSYQWSAQAWAIVRVGAPVVLAFGIVARAAALLKKTQSKGDRWHGEALTVGFALYAMVWTALLVVDGRYRDIPEIDFAVPCVGVAVLAIIRAVVSGSGDLSFIGLFPSSLKALADGRRRPLLIMLALGLMIAAVLSPVSEAVALAQGQDFARDHPTWADRWPLLLNAMLANREMLIWAIMQLIMAMPFIAAIASMPRLRR